ncbi:RNA 2',3'-cyclic phosphodiesterase [Gracilibacillus xinjiangensis]|uniref:RNA 2',3'-cyclic phosphodiesterase n=1 Tax=Gracilibacillus xinjiangensis TaxID=1193282 RepID=A0ABV8WUU2_9BACI
MKSDPHYFIAIKIDDTTKKSIASIQAIVNAKSIPFKIWVHEQDLHITLQFLGAVNEKKLEVLQEKLRVVEEIQPFTTKIGGLQTFGKKAQPRVLWADVEKKSEIMKLYKKVTNECRELEIQTDTRSYQPHITLAKKWNDRNIQLDETVFENELNIKLEIREVAIYRINLGNKVKYEPIAIYRLQGEKRG